VEGSEVSDEEAKRAARGHSSARADLPAVLHDRLPISKFAAKQKFRMQLQALRMERFEASPRCTQMRRIDPSTLSK
ncbi:hypothetical protein FA95DRAFT_1473957, partial [Auriscalpium vulgare]